MTSKTPEVICKFLVLMFKADESTYFSAVDFNGIVKTLIGKIPELISSQDFASDPNRPSESYFIHGFNDAVLAKERTEGFLENYKDRLGKKPTIRLPISEEDRQIELENIFEKINEFFENLTDEELKAKSRRFDIDARIIQNPYEFILQRRGTFLVKSSQSAEGPQQKAIKTHSIVFCGPPGTGKTRAALITSDRLLRGIEIDNFQNLQLEKFPSNSDAIKHTNFYRVQFHPSFSYEDFIEGLRPEPVNHSGKSDVTYIVRPGVLKIVAQLACAYQLPEEYGIPFYCQYIDNKWRIEANSDVQVYRFIQRNGYFSYRGQVVAESGFNKNEHIYEKNGPPQDGLYELEWFAYKDNQVNDFVLFIDEFNRGNPARIFGESLSLIEHSKRMDQEEPASITLPYSRKDLSLPSNLHIICAMNLADRSLSHIDQALRRRFQFIYLKPQMQLLQSEDYQSITGRRNISSNIHDEVIKHFELINQSLLGCGVPSENHIGHSYGFKLLSNFYANRSSESDDKVLIQKCLSELWAMEIHSLVRDILGSGRMDRFCKEVEKLSQDPDFSSNVFAYDRNALKTYINDPNPDTDVFPWQAA